MKKVLIISYYWPPSGGSPALRWLKFVKYLRDFGWEPVVYTPSNPQPHAFDESLLQDIPQGIQVIKKPIWEPYQLFAKFTGQKKNESHSTSFISSRKKSSILNDLAVWIRGNLFIPDARKYWIRPSVKFLKKYLQTHPVNAIVSTGPPHSMHMIAYGLKRALGIPWLADFRDPWTNIDFYKELKISAWADKKHHRLEKKVLESADKVLAVSPTMAKEFNQLAPIKAELLTNGYDEMPQNDEGLDNKFSILHLGSMAKSRNPRILWDALRQLSSEIEGFEQDLRIELVGDVDYQVIEDIDNSGLKSNISRVSFLSNKEALLKEQQAQLLLLVINQAPNALGILTNKFFEYMAANRPILAFGPKDGDAAKILRATRAGEMFALDEKEGLLRFLRKAYQAYKSSSLRAETIGIAQYSRKELTRSLSSILESIV